MLGGDGARTMMLVYDLPATDAIYQRFVGIEGSAYFVGGLGMTALSFNNIVVVPVRSGVGLRLGANVGYLKFTPTSTWNPFLSQNRSAAASAAANGVGNTSISGRGAGRYIRFDPWSWLSLQRAQP